MPSNHNPFQRAPVAALAPAVVALLLAACSISPTPSAARPDQPGEAAAWRLKTLRSADGSIPADAMMTAKAQAAAMNIEGVAGGLDSTRWTAIGPGNVGGRIRAVALHPTIAGTLFIGSVAGGLWKSTDSGATWSAIDDLMSNLAITSIVFTPGNPSVMYAGTGEGFTNIDALQGAGIFKSTDGGTNWARLASTAIFEFVNRLAISPNGSVILASCTGSNAGVYRSTDGGGTWTQFNGGGNGRSLDVRFHPTNSNIAVAHFLDYDFGISGWFSSVHYSTDGGVTWAESAGTRSNVFGDRLELAFHRGWTGAGNGCVYAQRSVNNDTSTTLYRSTDGGASFSVVNTGLSILGTQGWYCNALWVDPSDTDANPANDVIVGGGIDLWRSTDGGATFSAISQWFSAPQSAHADHHTIVEDPGFDGVTNKTVWFGNDGGMYRAADVYSVSLVNGWTSLNSNLPITQFYGASRHAVSGIVVAGAQDNGTQRYTTAGGANAWTEMFGGDGGACASDPTDSNYQYGEYTQLQIHRSTNGGQTSSYIHAGITDAGSGSTALFIAPFVLDPNNANRMLAGGARLWRSNDVKAATPSWSVIKPAIGGGVLISAIAVAPGNADVIWVGYDNGDVFHTTNGTAGVPTWTQRDTSAPGLPDRYITRITLDANDHNHVFVTLGGYATDNLWQSTNAGGAWTAATGLPASPVRDVAMHEVNTTWLYAATEVGLLVSEDNGVSWSSAATPSTVSIDELFWSSHNLYLATHGRGIFRQAAYPAPATMSVGSACTFGGPVSPALSSSLSTLGTSTTWTLTGGPVNGIWALFLSTVPGSPVMPWPGCFVQLDLGNALSLVTLPLSASGASNVPVPLPDAPELAGMAMMTQAVCVDAGLAQFTISNGWKVTPGY